MDNDKDVSLEEQIAFIKSNINILKKDLQENCDTYSPEACEQTEDYIYALQTTVEELQKVEVDLESLLRNPYREENFKIEKSMSGSYMVRSDSKRFGEQAVVYENRDRNECVDYIEERQPAQKPAYYVIENLHDFMKGKNENIIRGTLKECLEKYSEYIQNPDFDKEEYKDHVTCTFGVATDRNDMDLVHYINGTSYAGTDIIRNQEHNTNKYILDDIEAIVDILDIREAAKVRENNIDYMPLEQLDGKEMFDGYSKKTMAEKEELARGMQGIFSNGHLQKVFFNGVPLSKTGYNGAPEVTQELFDAMMQSNKNNTENMNFKGCYFFEVTLQGKFESANFENCYFSLCKFENAEFRNAEFKNASINADMNNVKFSETSFMCAGIYNSRWKDTHFDNVNFNNSTWKHVSSSRDTVSFQNCDFLLTDMASVYIQGSRVTGEMKNIDSIYVTLGGATSAEIENHRKGIIDTLGNGNVAFDLHTEKELLPAMTTNQEKLIEYAKGKFGDVPGVEIKLGENPDTICVAARTEAGKEHCWLTVEKNGKVSEEYWLDRGKKTKKTQKPSQKTVRKAKSR